MSARTRVVLSCDGRRGCMRTFQSTHPHARAARSEASSYGWVVRRDDKRIIDLCPLHAPKPKAAAS